MVTHILVGVDNSDTARSAAVKAAALAQAFGAELHVVSAYGRFEAEHIRMGTDSFTLTNHDEAMTVARQVITSLRPTYPDLKFHPIATAGKPGEALVRTAEALNVDLIVVGNKRVQSVGRVLGNIARDVARSAHCDLYVANTTR